MDVQIVAVVIGALLGGTISTVSFYFKNKKEVKGKINESLFHLLEIRSFLVMVKVITSDDFHIMLIARLKERFPHESVTKEDELMIKEGIVKGIPIITGADTGRFNDSLLQKFKDSISELAKVYPMQAFELNRNYMLINVLNSLDQLSSEAPVNSSEMAIFENIQTFMLEESLEDLETDLIKLASSSGYRNKKNTVKYIDRANSRREGIPSELVDLYIEKVISPYVQAGYDEMGVKNPNVEAEEESTECV